ncbi:ribosomal RNA methyltransferase MRM2 [Durotheca rogersii]|uniref:ribosomal RNA methyltransferase MRM2 n=1 Tax=Durotheca rogersii TaxID=419775 RepID=UPI0022210647|nr:ribosomal RNA methyltransferase MRM2 [Durotheca rogersii]KAI5861240.1 ribosomal RNA methyltransferase MRM2 [Durotheca rogersii]
MRALARITTSRGGLARVLAVSYLSLAAAAVAPSTPWRYTAPPGCARAASSASSSQWKQRQARDWYGRAAKVASLKSRAAFKLIEMDSKYKLFKSGQTVIDLGYAPGSWSQVAVELVKPHGRVVGVDMIPAQPPKGVSTLQGDFRKEGVQKLLKDYLVEFPSAPDLGVPGGEGGSIISDRPSYIDTERADSADHGDGAANDGRLVDVILSDMWAPWARATGYPSRTLDNAYYRLMNVSGNNGRDHAGSMLLCNAALKFANDTLRAGGHFVCKFYQGNEEKVLEGKLKKLFTRVHREKPYSSRPDSKEMYFVAQSRKGAVILENIDDT